MSAKHPTPWTVINCNNGARGKWFYEWGNIVDDNGIFIVDGMDLATAREIAEAINGRAALRDLVRQSVETLEQVLKHADMTASLREVVVEAQREARKALEGAE